MVIVCITGATSGIGKAAAIEFAKKNCRLILTGRRNDRLSELARELESDWGVEVHTLCFDVRKEPEVNAAFESLPDEWKAIEILVNNAGLARGFCPVEDALLSDLEEMIDTNLKGVIYVSRAVIPGMKARKQGHIINIGSTAGKEVYPNGNVYCATKHGLDALTKGMRMDLLPYFIRVSSLQPGFVETEFSIVRFHGDEDRAKKVYEGFQPLKAEDVAATLVWMASAPEHVNIADVLLLPAAQGGAGLVRRI